jgi:phosphatidylglycerophosphate synthase/putative flippase GtrA
MMQTVLDVLAGRLSAQSRVWTALAPALIIAGYWWFGFCWYLVRQSIKGPYRDPEMAARGDTPLTGMFLRHYFAWIIQPLWKAVYRTGIPPSAVTTLSVLLSTASGVALGAGRFALGGWLYIFGGVLDVLDGRLARARNIASKKGAALDSVLDRYSDSAVLVGLSWYYRDTWVLLAAQLALVGSSLVPYIRARGEASGVVIKDVGIMQRAERIVYLGVAVAMSPVIEVMINPEEPRPLHRLAVMGVVLLAVSTQLTALQRLVHLLAALDERPASSVLGHFGRGPLIRNVVSALSATVTDAALYGTLVVTFAMMPPLATAIACFIGAVVNFTVNRVWAFNSTDPTVPQIGRYSFVSVTSLLLNAGGVAVLLMVPAVNYWIAWCLVRAAVFVAWNFPLQRDYVFVSARQSQAA